MDGFGIFRTGLHWKTFQIRRPTQIHHPRTSIFRRQTHRLDISRFLQRKNLCPDRWSKSLSKTGWYVHLQKVSSVTISSRGSHFITWWQSSGNARRPSKCSVKIWKWPTSKWPMLESPRHVILLEDRLFLPQPFFIAVTEVTSISGTLRPVISGRFKMISHHWWRTNKTLNDPKMKRENPEAKVTVNGFKHHAQDQVISRSFKVK